MEPKISIVFTSYNHREFLVEALDGLINQTFKNFELLIIDDCSTDGSQEVLKRYTVDSRVKLHLLDNNSGSYVHSSNFGANIAIADYIIFAQCDDYAEPKQLEMLLNAICSQKKTGVSFCCSNLVDAASNKINTDYAGREKKFKEQCSQDTTITSSQMIKYLSKACVIPNLSAALIRKDLFFEVGGLSEDYKVIADWDFWLKVAKQASFNYVASSLNNFRQHSTTIRSRIKIQIQIMEIFTMMYCFLSEHKTTFTDRLVFKTNISVIWIGYIHQSPLVWVKSFFPIFFKICLIDIFSPIYFIIAFSKVSYNLIIRKMLNE